MSKISTERARIALNGPTMGTRWSVTCDAEPGVDAPALEQALAAAVLQVDVQMSPWLPGSDLNRVTHGKPPRGKVIGGSRGSAGRTIRDGPPPPTTPYHHPVVGIAIHHPRVSKIDNINSKVANPTRKGFILLSSTFTVKVRATQN